LFPVNHTKTAPLWERTKIRTDHVTTEITTVKLPWRQQPVLLHPFQKAGPIWRGNLWPQTIDGIKEQSWPSSTIAHWEYCVPTETRPNRLHENWNKKESDSPEYTCIRSSTV
jgi:hypothetical protein